MGTNISSQKLSFPEVCIVEASAGSGKTYALAKRYLQLLINPRLKEEEIPLRNILAITFTLKATREMRERILEQLKKIALNAFDNDDEKKDLLSAVGINEEKAREKAFRVLDYIICHYNFFQVKNIDKFINLILSGCASELNLSANFRIKENYVDYVAYALDECIDQVSHDRKTAEVFEHFLNQYLFLENRTSWLPKKDVLNIINGLFSQSNIYGGSFEKFPIASKELIILKQEVLSILKDISARAPEGVNKIFLKTLNNFLRNNARSFNVSALDKKSFQKDCLPMNKNHDAPADLALLWEDFRRHIIEISEKEALSLFNCYIDIFNSVYAYFREYARKDNLVFMEELNKQARVLFDGTNISVPELYYRLASRFRHFLIDEFQDTSRLQWGNLFLMIEDALSTGGSLFYVGDKKQAIYRFRGGDVNLFDYIKTEFSKFNVNDKLSLTTNYRSQKEVILFNNEIFSSQNLKRFLGTQQDQGKDTLRQFTESEIEEVLSVFKDSQQQDKPLKPHGYVNIDYIEYEDKETSEELVRARLVDTMICLQKRFPLKSIAILCRSNREIERVTGWLSEKKINVESERTLNIMNNSLVRELIAFLKFLNSPIDNISFSAFILGDVFLSAVGLKREEVADFIFIFNAQEDKGSGYLYRVFRKQYADIWDRYIAKFFKSVGFVSLYELLISLLDKFCVLKNYSDYQGFFMRFLELVKEQEEENPDISLFLDYLETAPDKHLYVNFSDENAVKVMTIHKAKGLGFPVVLVPFLDMNIRDLGAQIKKVKAPYVVYEKEKEGTYGLLRLDTKYAKFSPRIRERYRKEYVKSFIDELNVIYVTFTRAQNELYLFIPYNPSKNTNAAALLIPEGITSRGRQVEYSAREVADMPKAMPIGLPQYTDWIVKLKDEFVQKTELRNRESIMRGEILHDLLSRVGDLNVQKEEQVLKNLNKVLEQEYPGVENVQDYLKIIEKLISAKETKRIFYPENIRVYPEKEFVDKYGITKRIDRLLVGERTVEIIDFKSSEENKEDQYNQIKDYIRIVKDIYQEKKVSGSLVYMDKIKVEKIDE
ncbi:MAG: UvrD-helicase domain-containing protein [PVC group bacterium]|nr:UvrD-helicase domain-containing protein [PVC group bacterium]